MTPPRNIIGTLRHSPYLHDRRKRWTIFAALIVLCGLFTLFPQRYHAAMTMTPTDPASLGLSSALGESGAVNSVFGTQAAVEVVLKVGKSKPTRLEVMRKLDLKKKLGLGSSEAVVRWIDRAVVIRSLRGGIVTIETWQTDPDLARALVGALADSTRDSLAQIGKRQTAYKRAVLGRLLRDADRKLANAQDAYDRFRLVTRYAQPGNAIAGIGTRVAYLKEVIRSKETQLFAARQFATDENQSVRQLLAEIASLKDQLKRSISVSDEQLDSVGDVVEKSTRVRELERVLQIAHARHDNYERLYEGTSVEDITKDAVVRIIEEPYIDADRQYNFIPLIIGLLLGMLAVAIEFYGFRPPVGDKGE